MNKRFFIRVNQSINPQTLGSFLNYLECLKHVEQKVAGFNQRINSWNESQVKNKLEELHETKNNLWEGHFTIELISFDI